MIDAEKVVKIGNGSSDCLFIEALKKNHGNSLD